MVFVERPLGILGAVVEIDVQLGVMKFQGSQSLEPAQGNESAIGTDGYIGQTAGSVAFDAIATQEVAADVDVLGDGHASIGANAAAGVVLVRRISPRRTELPAAQSRGGVDPAGIDPVAELGEDTVEFIVSEAGLHGDLGNEVRRIVAGVVSQLVVKTTGVSKGADHKVCGRRPGTHY